MIKSMFVNLTINETKVVIYDNNIRFVFDLIPIYKDIAEQISRAIIKDLFLNLLKV